MGHVIFNNLDLATRMARMYCSIYNETGPSTRGSIQIRSIGFRIFRDAFDGAAWARDNLKYSSKALVIHKWLSIVPVVNDQEASHWCEVGITPVNMASFSVLEPEVMFDFFKDLAEQMLSILSNEIVLTYYQHSPVVKW